MTDRVKKPRHPHPMQPIVIATDRVARFQANAIVRWLLDEATEGRKADMNAIARQDFSREDQEHFAQLIGYSVSGFGSLSYVRKAVAAEADRKVAALFRKTRRSTP